MDEKKQIGEMANELATLMLRDRNLMSVCEKFYNAGYRKQTVGEWNTNIPATIRVFETNSITCSLCGCGCGGGIDKPYPNFCPNCGARMR